MSAFGCVEALSYPFIGSGDLDNLGLRTDDARRSVLLLANPLSDERPGMRTTLLPGLLGALRRNVGRGQVDLALFEAGPVFLLREGQAPRGGTDPPRPSVLDRPSTQDLAVLESLLPDQPQHLAAAFCGQREPAGWWGPALATSWADAVESARVAAASVHADLVVRTGAAPMPWHPGRSAELVLNDIVVGYAGELHPRVVAALGVPARTAVMELDLGVVLSHATSLVLQGALSTYPVAKEDVALIVAEAVVAADVHAALVAGAGDLLESVRLFDVYTGEQVGEGRKSLAFALRFRAPDRTLTVEEVTVARDAAIAAANVAVGAFLRV